MSDPKSEDPLVGWCCQRPTLKTVTTDAGTVTSCEHCSGHWFLYNYETRGRPPGKDFYKPIRPVKYG